MNKPDRSKTKSKAPQPTTIAPVVRVGILCRPGSQSISYQSFLRKKDFDVKLYHKLDQSVRGALVDQIRFLFVDLDLPDPKVNQLVIAVAKVLPIYIIPYANSSHTKLRAVQPHLKTPYCIFPPTTPSAIHRMIVRIQLEEERAKTLGEGDVFLKSSILPASDDGFITIEDRKKIEEKLMTVFKTDKVEIDDFESIEQAKILQLNESQESQKNLSDGTIHGSAESAKDSALVSEKPEAFGKKNVGLFTDESAPSGKILGKLDSSVPEGIQKGVRLGSPFQSKLTPQEKTLISRGTLEALQKTFGGERKESPSQAFSPISEVYCFMVSTQRFKGYMLYAHSGQAKGHRLLLKLIRDKLAAFLKENGEVMKADEALLDLKVIEVDLEPWAFETAEFLVKTADSEEEVAMVFVPREDVDTHLEASAKKEMLKFKLNEIKANTKLEFDCFLFMPVNNKYLKYQKQGQKFADLQKKRLQQKGIEDVHVKKEAMSDVQKYRAIAFLDEKILEFKNKKAA